MSQNQKPLIYPFVAKGNVLLTKYTEFSGNFNFIAFQCLQKLPASNNKFTYNCDAHTFSYLVDDGYMPVNSIYVAVSRGFLYLCDGFLESNIDIWVLKNYGVKTEEILE
ncbi:hypothetical protein EZV62_004887 [Acer yangbiense]|uniref:Longin domain-containing protein n=1 Tax=Acer yangbiense TaxID=1000413 RepID=A0A5C7IMY5_9ROSI|nr:hypothetical protein EZV62_004887 [Acer yangbiense]